MRIRIPPKRTRERFQIIYELKGCQKGVDFLTEYYGVRKMRIILNDRKVGNGDDACSARETNILKDYQDRFAEKNLD